MGTRHFVIEPAAAQTASFNTGAIETSSPEILVSALTTASGGTSPTLDLEVEWSPDGTNWASADTPQTFTQITGDTVASKRFEAQARYYRIAATIGGTTPTFTLTLFGSHFDR